MIMKKFLRLGIFSTILLNSSQFRIIHSSILRKNPMLSLGYVDAHAHLIHEKFSGEEDQIANKCKEAGLEFVIVNGLEPISNRAVIELSYRHSHLLPALGIYPIDAACNVIDSTNWKHPFAPPTIFDVDLEVAYIDQMASEKKIIAIGECGLDAYYLNDTRTREEQERVLRMLMKVAKRHDIPLILHTRKAEERVLEMLIEEEVRKADFHCFCGKVKLGVKIAQSGYYLSIPTSIAKGSSSPFRALVKAIPFDKLLTETDAPYQGPDAGIRNDPSNIPRGIQVMAEVKNIPIEEMIGIVRGNFRDLFGV